MNYREEHHGTFALPGVATLGPAAACREGSSAVIHEGMWAEVGFLKALFSTRGVLIAVYILIGVFLNTAPPHLPTTPSSVASFHSWVQYIISVFFWPLGLWQPTFILGKWTP